MKKALLTIGFALGFTGLATAQLMVTDSTSAQDPTVMESSAILQLNSDDKGLLVPRASRSSIDATTSNNTTNGMLTYDPTDNTFYIKTENGWMKLD